MNELGGSEAFGFTVSHTTRQPRPGEKNGIHYHFTTHHIMERHIENGRFLEHAKVHGHLYGTSWDALEDVQVNQKKKCLLDIDVQGVQTLKQLNLAADKWQPRYVFIAPPSLPVLLERLSSRGTESEESIRIRSSKAKEEVDYGTKEGVFDAIVVNDDLDESCREFAEVVRGLYYS
jgi:guanylate kinase